MASKTESLAGLIQTVWIQDRKPTLDWDALLERTVAADKQLEEAGHNPAPAFRKHRRNEDLKRMYHYVTRGFSKYPFSPSYDRRSSKPPRTSTATASDQFQGVSPSVESPSITTLFHRLGKILPQNQNVKTVSPDTRVSEALQIMHEQGFSQLPVVLGREVFGVFSYRFFAQNVLSISPRRFNSQNLTVGDFIDKVAFQHVTDDFDDSFDHLDEKDAVLIGDPKNLRGIVTTMDVLLYWHNVASDFVLLEEIERALRELFRLCVDQAQLEQCVARSLSHKPGIKLPQTLEEMSSKRRLPFPSGTH